MSTIFTKIIEGEIPGHFIYEDDICVAIMELFPNVEGQSLVILKREVDYAFDMTDDEYQHVFSVAKKIAKASDKAFGAERTCMVVEGFEVPHVHIRLYPFKSTGGASLKETIGHAEQEDAEVLAKNAEKIKAELDN